MSTSPYMPLYIADYLADAAHLTTEEHGAYLLLIMTYWQRGKALSADPKRLAAIARLSNERWTDVQRTLSEFFTDVDGEWQHKRIENELAKYRDKVGKAKSAGEASAKSRKPSKSSKEPQRTLNGRSTDAQRPSNHSESESYSDSESEVLGPPENSEQVAASGPVEVSGLNGSTQLIVESFANWLSPYAPDFAAAHKSIAEAVQIYGPDAVRDGFADLKADHADGKVRALSVKAFYGFVRTAKERKGKAMAERPASGKPMSAGAAWHEEKRRNAKIILALANGEAVPQ